MALQDILKLEKTGAERRQHERTKLIVDIHFNGVDATGIASSRDIGIGGLYLITQADLPAGATLLMRLTFGREEPKELVIKGVVAYTDEGQGVGVRFHDLTPEAEAVLKAELNME